MSIEIQNKVTLLKENNEDFEWYPTTDEMISVVFRDCGDVSSILDVGAGDGRVLERFHKLKRERAKNPDSRFSGCLDKYAIEKALIHIENMPPDISIVGTDFMRQTLIDKKVDMVFCNPPYSEYEAWASRIIKEANAKTIYLVIPERWVNSKPIELAIKQRGAISKIIWSGDFMNAERQARAKVNTVKVVITTACRERESEQSDPFDVWFNTYFSGFNNLKEDDERHSYEKEPIINKNELVEGQNLVEVLAELYRKEMDILLNNYKVLSDFDTELLKELGVRPDEIKKALKLKIEGLKNKYWQELFDNLDKITSRLTKKSRESMLGKLRASCNVDFSFDNAYAIVIWVIKNANKYLEQQLVEFFKELSEPECVKNYKSNIKTWEKDRWRYKQQGHTHYTLEYRIITSQYNAIKTDTYGYDYTNNLSNRCHSLINDIFTIANNLSFANIADSRSREWESNVEEVFYYSGGKTLVKVRAFKNGNLHMKFDQDFIKTLNIEASRLLGWIKTPQEAAYEMDLGVDFVTPKFKSNLLFGVHEGQKLLIA